MHAQTMKKVSFLLDDPRIKEDDFKGYTANATKGSLSATVLCVTHGLQSLPPSPKRTERKERQRPFREAGSGHKQWNMVSCVDTFSIISKFSAQNSKI